MRSLIAAELLKLRSTRSAWIPLAVALAAAILAVVASATAAGHGGNPEAQGTESQRLASTPFPITRSHGLFRIVGEPWPVNRFTERSPPVLGSSALAGLLGTGNS